MKTLRYKGVPVIGFAGYSGSGKTAIMREIIPLLKSRGLRPAVIKHAHHEFDIDYPRKDSYELRKAGAAQILVGSAHRWALISESGNGDEPDLGTFLSRLDLAETDIVLVEGFRDVAFPKIEIHRTAEARRPFHERDPNIVAVISDDGLPAGTELPGFRPDETDRLTDFLVAYCSEAAAP